MAARIIESVDIEPAPLRMMLGSQALESTIDTLRQRIDDFEQQTDLAASTDFPSSGRERPIVCVSDRGDFHGVGIRPSK
jgi:hypothetical protein